MSLSLDPSPSGFQLSMMINLIVIIYFEFAENQNPPTFFEVIRMTEAVILGTVYVNFKAFYVIQR